MKTQTPPSSEGYGTALPFGRPVRVARRGPFSLRLDLRVTALCLGLLAVVTTVSVFALTTGEFGITPTEVLQALSGEGSRKAQLVVVEWRLPRVALAVLGGLALGASGAIFQSLTRNPLGSPDVIGFNTGAYTGAVTVIMILGGTYYQVAAGALVGGIATAAVVYILAYKRGVQGFRLIIVGIGISTLLSSVNTWMLIKADLDTALAAATWGAGSLGGVGHEHLIPVAAVLAAILPIAAVLGRPMRILEMGDDTARGMGLRVEPLRLTLIVTGVALTAVITAATGPIAFIALAAPQLARRLARTPGTAVLPSALMGAALLATSDLVAQRAFAPSQLPVGVVTVTIGGAYLVWLLLGEARRHRT
ncbi:iron complex transport system permease protein [Sinosporangium album]|uniref:Iron complex transport system permease protein n=1 Tax=Sinosporangium album TaxID=504805 RepID=A0A1G8KLS6_9ACTN|nr:iron chelate uptake ABC transporter family permease subunit [Sinosporangium album]SDI44336.1 iron complex transport system permease protein [Sinosporangium album]